MPERLHWKTATPLLKAALTGLMESNLFESFRLVGGTSLSLQLGHRISIDIDLFTDAQYESIDFKLIDTYLRKTFPYVSEFSTEPVGMGVSCLIGEHRGKSVKLDLYYTDAFIQPALKIESLRLASIEEIIAMKIDIVQRKARKKDFWDIHELISEYSPSQMIALHAKRYPLIMTNN